MGLRSIRRRRGRDIEWTDPRAQLLEALDLAAVDGDHRMEPAMPESFNVLVKEMQSLGMDVKVGYNNPVEAPSEPDTTLANLG